MWLRNESTLATESDHLEIKRKAFDYSDSVRINYYEIGRGDKPIILLHGFSASALKWDTIWKSFPEKYSVVEIVNAFLSIVPRYPVGSNCEIVSGKFAGYQGVVISLNDGNLNTPNIRLLYNDKGIRIDPININLDKHLDV